MEPDRQDDRRAAWPPRLIDPGPVSILVAVAAFRFGFTTAGDLDPSWRLGLGWAHVLGFDHGEDLFFTFGPLGVLSTPTLAAPRRFLALALLAAVAAAVCFGRVVVRTVRRSGWGPGRAALAVAIGLLAGMTLGLPELVAITAALDVHSRLPATARRPPTPAQLAAYGALGGVMLLVKLNSGVILAVLLALLALAWPGARERVARLLTIGGAWIATALVLWLITGNPVGDLPTWLRGSIDVIGGYGTSMARNPTDSTWAVAESLLVVALVLLLAAGQWSRMRGPAWRAQWPEAALLAAMTWFLLKTGFVRFDGHVIITLAGLTALSLLVHHAGTRPVVRAAPPLLAVAGLLAAGWTVGASETADQLRYRLERRGAQPGQVWRAARAIVSPAEQERQVDEAKQDIRAYYERKGLDGELVDALRGRRAHADQWDIAALWAHDLTWRPLPVLQGYSAYTPWLDRRDADALLDADRGPDAVLRSSATLDSRRREWDAPSSNLALACTFETVAARGAWSVLHRAPDLCGEPIELGRVRAEPDEPIEVPDAPGDGLLVATFEVHPSLGKRALDLLARDPDLALVLIDGRQYRFVAETAEGMHLLRQPDRLGGRDLPGGELDLQTIRFQGLGGPVEATFYEVPLS